MTKGISLEQFKNQLESNATKRCEAQEKTIKELHEQIKDKDEWIRVLQNRCYTLSYGALCGHCGGKDNCKSKNGLVR